MIFPSELYRVIITTQSLIDLIGEGENKTLLLFLIIWATFEFFRQHKEGLHGNEAHSLSEAQKLMMSLKKSI